MPEITKEQLDYYISQDQIANAANSIWNDPELGQEARALLKKKMPNLQIPDHDLRAEIRNEFATRDQKAHEEREASRIAQEDAYWKSERKKVQDAYGYTEDGMRDLEKMMYERNIGDYEVAATYHSSKNPKPSEPTAGYKDPYWNHTKSDLFKEIAKDPEEWGRNEIMNALRNDQKARNQF
jgi:hypothetical protein